MDIHFSKYHGLGNDYLFLDTILYPEIRSLNTASLAAEMSHRRLGAGADGIILILPSDTATVAMRIFNSDGSEAENCGNALRCLARICRERGYSTENHFTIKTGDRHAGIFLDSDDADYTRIRVNIGKARFWHPGLSTGVNNPSENVRISIPGTNVMFDADCVDVGNPHCVLFCDQYTDNDVLNYGPLIEHHSLFPKRINAGFCRVENPSMIHLVVWERGAGLTGACGTGAAAAFAAAKRRKRVSNHCSVQMPGGFLDFCQDSEGSIHMTGPAVHVYDGVWKLHKR